jgi:hypothetical protein
MEESQKAMGVAAHYRIVNQGMEVSIYQKPLPDGSIAMLTDISAPIKRSTIKYGDKSYDMYLEKKIAVDTSALLTEAKSMPGIAQLFATKDMKVALKLTRTFTDNGKEYYEMEQVMQIPANLPPAMAKSIPAKNRFVIDAETFLIHEHEMSASDGSSITKLRYLGFEPMPDLTDDIFQLPDGFEVLSPQSINEYAVISLDLLRPRIPPVDIQEEFERIKRGVEAKRPRQPAEMIFPVVSPPTQLPEHLDRSQYDYPLPEKPKRPWAIIIAVNVIIVALMIWLIYRNRKSR